MDGTVLAEDPVWLFKNEYKQNIKRLQNKMATTYTSQHFVFIIIIINNTESETHSIFAKIKSGHKRINKEINK